MSCQSERAVPARRSFCWYSILYIFIERGAARNRDPVQAQLFRRTARTKSLKIPLVYIFSQLFESMYIMIIAIQSDRITLLITKKSAGTLCSPDFPQLENLWVKAFALSLTPIFSMKFSHSQWKVREATSLWVLQLTNWMQKIRNNWFFIL